MMRYSWLDHLAARFGWVRVHTITAYFEGYVWTRLPEYLELWKRGRR